METGTTILNHSPISWKHKYHKSVKLIRTIWSHNSRTMNYGSWNVAQDNLEFVPLQSKAAKAPK